MLKESKSGQAIIYAKSIGMMVDPDGKPFGVRGSLLSTSTDKVGYPRISVMHPQYGRITFATHKLQAYQKFGDLIFQEGVHIRHLNGNSLDCSWGNISLGSPQENSLDRKPEDRMESARRAAKARRRFTNQDIENMIRKKAEGFSLRVLAEEYGTTKGHMSDIVNRKLYKVQ